MISTIHPRTCPMHCCHLLLVLKKVYLRFLLINYLPRTLTVHVNCVPNGSTSQILPQIKFSYVNHAWLIGSTPLATKTPAHLHLLCCCLIRPPRASTMRSNRKEDRGSPDQRPWEEQDNPPMEPLTTIEMQTIDIQW